MKKRKKLTGNEEKERVSTIVEVKEEDKLNETKRKRMKKKDKLNEKIRDIRNEREMCGKYR